MSTSRLRWSRKATSDLQRVAEFIRSYNPAKEQEVTGALVLRAEQLRTQPRSGQKRQNLPGEVEQRSLLVAKFYRLVYAVTPNDDVTILQVLDLRSDQEFYR